MPCAAVVEDDSGLGLSARFVPEASNGGGLPQLRQRWHSYQSGVAGLNDIWRLAVVWAYLRDGPDIVMRRLAGNTPPYDPDDLTAVEAGVVLRTPREHLLFLTWYSYPTLGGVPAGRC